MYMPFEEKDEAEEEADERREEVEKGNCIDECSHHRPPFPHFFSSKEYNLFIA